MATCCTTEGKRDEMTPTVLSPAITLILIGLVLLAYVLWGKSRAIPAIWGLGNIAHGVGWLVTGIPGYSTNPHLVVLSNLLLGVAVGLLWKGIAHFVNQHRPPLLLMLPSLVILVTFPIFVYVIPSLPARVIIASVLTGIACGDSGRMLLRDLHRPTQLVGFGLIGVMLFEGLRALTALLALWYPEPLLPLIHNPHLPVAALLVFTVCAVGMLLSLAHRSEIAFSEQVAALRTASLTDQLTDLPNRRCMQELLEGAQKRLDQQGETYSILLLDIDHFKQINDAHGHEAGDLALQHTAQMLRVAAGNQYMVARWGGEEFIMLMPNIDAGGALAVAEELRKMLFRQLLYYGEVSVQITGTIGVTTAAPDQKVGEVVRRADHALYQGKQQGRNLVIGE